MNLSIPAKFLLGVSLLALCLSNITLAEPPGTQPALVQAGDRAALDGLLEKEVLLEGTVLTAEWSRTGRVMNIEFNDAPDGALAVVFDRNRADLDGAFGGDLATALKGARVRLKGRLQPYGGRSDRFKDRPQVILRERSQITILEAAPAGGSAAHGEPANADASQADDSSGTKAGDEPAGPPSTQP